MAQNEISQGSKGPFNIEYFYRVTIIGFVYDPESESFTPTMRDEDFRAGNLLENKERALRYFTDAVSAFMLEGKYLLPYRGEVDWSKCNPEGYKFMLYLIKLNPDNTEEEFPLIGGSDDELDDSQMEEEITFVIHRKSGML
jgi:hypothetical protein